MIAIYNIENKIIKKEMVVRYRLTELNENKIAYIKRINVIEEKQLDMYCQIRESEIKMLTDKINDTRLDIYDITEECKQLYAERSELLGKLNSINEQIPSKTMVTNMTLKL